MPDTAEAWNTALSEKLLGSKCEGLIKAFLLAEIPEFEAPVDPGAWRRRKRRLRPRALRDVMLKGFPADALDTPRRVVWGRVLEPDPAYRIRKLRYEIFPDYWIPALLYEPTGGSGTLPVVLNPNGHHSGGKACIYKQLRCANLARRGVLALNMEFIGMGELQSDRVHNNIALLNLTGLAGVGLFYLALKKGLDILLAHDRADANRVGVTGLSGGGWQTIVISALDERVTLSVPVAGYTGTRARVGCTSDIGDLEQVPVDLTTVLDYQDMTAMLAPNPALLILNENDTCCFQTKRTKPVIYDAVLPTYRAFGAAARFECYSNRDPGTHNYDGDNRAQFYRFLAQHWGMPDPGGDIGADHDLLPESELDVGLPVAQQTMQSIAVQRARRLCRRLSTPATAVARRQLRRAVTRAIRLPDNAAEPAACVDARAPGNVVLWSGPWAIPASIETAPATASADLIVCDSGRAGSAVARASHPAHRIVPDILGTGENRPNERLLMLVEAAGHRLLGEQVAQVLACARWSLAHLQRPRVGLVGEGLVASFVCLVAAALEPRLFGSLTVHGNLTSLALLLESAERYESCQSLFCFGLLEVADVPQLVALLEDVSYRQPARCVPDTG